jgi:magnesium transporter
LLEAEQEPEVVNELPEDLRNAFLVELQPEALASIVGQLDDDDVADILQELPESVTSQVLAIMDSHDRARIETVLSYSDDVAGRPHEHGHHHYPRRPHARCCASLPSAT